MNQIAAAAAGREHPARPRRASRRRACSSAIGALFEAQSRTSRSGRRRQPARAREAGLDRLGQGIAIPHGRIKGLARGAGRVRAPAPPIPFDAPDGKPVAQVFVLLVPEQATEQHLQLLSELAQMFSEARVPRAPRAADRRRAQRARDVFARWQPGSAMTTDDGAARCGRSASSGSSPTTRRGSG